MMMSRHDVGKMFRITWQGELLDEHGALIRKLAPVAKQ